MRNFLKSSILLTLIFLNNTFGVAQESNSVIKFEGVKGWEQTESPTDIKYKVVDNWLKVPNTIPHNVVTGVAVDSKDKIYILDRGPEVPSVICVNTKGEFLFQWKLKGIVEPHLIAFDKDDFAWITDITTHQIHKLSKKGEVIFSLGEKNVLGSDSIHFNKPTDIQFLKNGECYITDGYGAIKESLNSIQNSIIFLNGEKRVENQEIL